MCCCFYILCLFFFLFKQKTAYEMRISDWSSDVCSSDLQGSGDDARRDLRRARSAPADAGADEHRQPSRQASRRRRAGSRDVNSRRAMPAYRARSPVKSGTPINYFNSAIRNSVLPLRSEEQTSALQSLMRTSYAVFCLKKK